MSRPGTTILLAFALALAGCGGPTSPSRAVPATSTAGTALMLFTDRATGFSTTDVRFGTRDGDRRAYLTWPGDPAPERPVTVLDVDVVAGRLVVADSGQALPGS